MTQKEMSLSMGLPFHFFYSHCYLLLHLDTGTMGPPLEKSDGSTPCHHPLLAGHQEEEKRSYVSSSPRKAQFASLKYAKVTRKRKCPHVNKRLQNPGQNRGPRVHEKYFWCSRVLTGCLGDFAFAHTGR